MKKIKSIELDKGSFIKIMSRPHKVTISIYPISVITAELYADAKANITGKADEYLKAVKEAADNAWPNIKPKVADSWGADYDEMYDTKRDVNYEIGGLRRVVQICGYPEDDQANYDFNKRRMQSYLFDLMEARDKEAEK